MNQSFSELLDWQWSDYSERHRNRNNLLIHIVAVPLFWLGAINFVFPLLFAGLLYSLSGLVLMALSIFVQGKGHEMEKLPPLAFQGPRDFLRRLLAEQFVTFPRFVFSGGWYRNLTSAS
jgi:hypothetical protein